MRKIKILHVTENLITGGAEKLLLDLLANHDPDRFEMAVLSVHPRTNQFIFEEVLDQLKNKVKIFYLEKQYKGLSLIVMLYKIIKIIKAFSPDIIHSHLNGIMYVILPAMFKKTPIRLQTVHLDALHEAFVIGGKVQEVSTTVYKLLKILPSETAKKIGKIRAANDNDKGQEEYKEYRVLGFLEKSTIYKKVSTGDFFEKAEIGGRLLKFAYKRSKFIPVAISNSVKNSLKKIYDLNDMPMIYNGIDTNVFKVRLNKGDESDEGSGSRSVKIIHIGRFDPAKNHELLVDAIAIVLRNFPNVNALLVGEGEYRASIMKKVIKSNLSNHVEFLGVRSDIPDLLSGGDIFVLSSIAEGFGLVLVEAMALGLPIVSTNVGGVKEVVRDGVNGILVEPNAPDALAEALEELIKNKERRKQMGQAGIAIAKGFDIHITTRKYNELYDRLFFNPGGQGTYD
jgi:glycosyltransferase involved in cell wall biosynthesis